VPPDRRAHRDRAAEVSQPAALFHVELDEAPHPAERRRVGGQAPRVAAGGAQRLRERRAVAVAKAQGSFRGERPGQQPR
jgi:hypothetical protein